MTVVEERNCGSLFFKVLDSISDAVLIYNASGLYSSNLAAKRLFQSIDSSIRTNIPLVFCSNLAERLPLNNMAAQWRFLHDHPMPKTQNLRFKLSEQEWVDAKVSIESANDDGQQFWLFIVSDVQQKPSSPPSFSPKIESLLNSIPFEVWIVDKNHKTILQNNASKGRWGNLEGMGLQQMDIDNDVKKLWQENYDRVVATQTATINEQRYTPNGKTAVVREIRTPLHDAHGDMVGVMGMNIDLTHQKTIEQSLHETESRYRTVANLAGSIIYEYTVADNKLSWQGPIEQITGYSPDEFEQFGFEDHIELIHPDDRELVTTAFVNAIRNHEFIKNEFRYRKKNGDYMIVEELGYVFYDHQNRPSHVIGSKRDITNHKLAETRIKESELWYRNLFEMANDAIFVIEDKMVVDCNSKAEKVFGRDKSQLVGQYGLSYSCETQANGLSSYERVLQWIERVEAGESCFYEWQFYRTNGTIFDAEVSLSMVKLPTRKLILAIVRDVSARKAMEKQLIANKKRYRNLFDTMFSGFVVLSPIFDDKGRMTDAVYIDANPHYLKQIGKERHDVISLTVKEMTGRDVVWIDRYEKVFKTGNSESFQGYHPVLNSHFRVKVFKPGDDYIAVMFDDITQQVLAEEIIHENQKKYQLLFDNMQSACTINMPIFNDQGRLVDFEYVEVNKSVEAQLGVPIDRIRGKRINELLSDYDKSWMDIYEKVIKTGESVNIEKYSAELKRHFRVNVFKQSEHYFATILDDITDLKDAERQIIETIVEVEERERRQLACDLHDDIGPQLVSMRMYLTTLLRMGLNNVQKEIYFTVIELLDQTIASVRAISANLSPALLQKFGLAAAINAECDHARVMFVVDFMNNIQLLRFDKKTEAMVYRIVKELLNNTKKYAEATHVNLSVNYNDHKLRLVYTDNGKGFDYHQTMASPHTGIGLTNIDMRVKSIDGTCAFGNNPLGTGMMFELSVPIDANLLKTEQRD